MKLFKTFTLIALAATALSSWAAPASYDDDYDDIYYNEAKDKKTKAERQAAAVRQRNYIPNVTQDYPDPAVYKAQGPGLNMDVDAYNRRGQFLVADSVPADSLDANGDTYAYTRRLEKFYNSDIVNGSNDQALIDSYYAQPATTDINVYVVNPSPWSYGFYNPWYYNSWYGPSWSWSWNWGWYDPWYSWSWNWGCGPGYWGPGWGWADPWGPAWGPGWGWGGSWGPSHGWGNGHDWAINNPGGSRPHRPAGSGGSSTASRRPGAFSAGASSVAGRPGNMGGIRGNGTYSPANGRPGTGISSPASRPSTGQGTVNMNRGRYGNQNSNSNVNNNSSRRTYDWNNGSSSGSYRSTGSGGGGRSTHGIGGGGGRSTGGGGGGTRGRGR